MVGRHSMQLHGVPDQEKEPWSGYRGENSTEMKVVAQYPRLMLIFTTRVPGAIGKPCGTVKSWFEVAPASK